MAINEVPFWVKTSSRLGGLVSTYSENPSLRLARRDQFIEQSSQINPFLASGKFADDILRGNLTSAIQILEKDLDFHLDLLGRYDFMSTKTAEGYLLLLQNLRQYRAAAAQPLVTSVRVLGIPMPRAIGNRLIGIL